MASPVLFVSSGDLIADRRYKWALDHAAQGDLAGAVDILEQTVEIAPGFATAWFALGAFREGLGDREGAVAAFAAARDHDPEDYHGARLQLARLGAGEVTPAMTATYVRRLFDQHAPDFDSALRDKLNYCGPELLLGAVRRACAARGRPARFARALDLGCGTGLVAEAFRPLVDHVTGMDLSSRMVEEAARKQLYDRLEAAELVAFLEAEAAGGSAYDLVIAGDVFVYLNDLRDAVAGAARVLAADGLFCFTAETHDGAGVLLRQTLRYAHAAGYLREVLARSSLAPLLLEPATTRTEKGVPVSGLLVVAAHAGAA